MPRHQRHFVPTGVVGLLVVVAGCSSSSPLRDESAMVASADVVVTYSAIGDVVSRLVGDAANVTVLIPNGQDQHDFKPSAKDVEALNNADLVVSNGLNLEEGLKDALAQAEQSGVAMFRIADHVTLLDSSASGAREAAREPGTKDPHVWLDPETLAESLPALAEALQSATGRNFTDEETIVVGELNALSVKIRDIVKPVGECKLVTGHDSLGYFAARYGCTVVGAVIPGFSTSAEASAGSIADLKVLAKKNNVKAIFTELGTPADVAAQIAKEVGVDVVELSTHVLPKNGGYNEMMSQLATAIAGGLL